MYKGNYYNEDILFEDVLYTVSLAGAERVDASEPVELDRESPSLTGKGNVSLIHLR